MRVAIRLSNREEIKALPILLRHSPGMMLKGGTYVLDWTAVQALQAAGVKYTALATDLNPPRIEPGERV